MWAFWVLVYKLTLGFAVVQAAVASARPIFGRGDDTVGNPHRAQLCQFELFGFFVLLKLDRRLPVEQFEPTVSQSTAPSLPPNPAMRARRAAGVIMAVFILHVNNRHFNN